MGGPDDDLPTAMGEGHLIESKKAQRASPPHIVLTNYKMLDFMLLRPDDRLLWRHNGPAPTAPVHHFPPGLPWAEGPPPR